MHQRMCHVSYLWEWLIISKYILEKEKGKGKPTGGSAEPDGPEPEPDGRGSARPAEKPDAGAVNTNRILHLKHLIRVVFFCKRNWRF